MNVQVRPLTDSERIEMDSRYQGTPVPPWGAVVQTMFGKVLIFDGSDNRRRYTVISGPDSESLIGEINRQTYTSPDAGLISFLEDATRNALGLGVKALNMVALAGVILLVAKFK